MILHHANGLARVERQVLHAVVMHRGSISIYSSVIGLMSYIF